MRQGFSLVELSIVLVILGLLTGGILAGQSLIRASELRAVSTEYQRYVTAIGTFRDKYFAIPGDMGNAQSFWGAAGVCPGDHTQPSTTATTCNGDADGMLENTAATSNEIFRFWQHLANAGLVEGTYSGVSSAVGTNSATPGLNVPRSKLSNGGWTPYYRASSTAGDGEFYAGSVANGNLFVFGTHRATGVTRNAIIKPEEAWNIDTKMDDGMPARGYLIASLWDDCTTSANNTDMAGQYALSVSTVACSLEFFLK